MRLLTDIINLYWDGYIHLDGLVKKYDVSDVTKAFRDLASGKSSYATVSLEQPKSLITVRMDHPMVVVTASRYFRSLIENVGLPLILAKRTSLRED